MENKGLSKFYSHQEWFEQFRNSPEYKRLKNHPIAYFCAEYGLGDQLPFSGGLGILSGDILKEAGDQKLPMIAVGLYYHSGLVCEKDEPKFLKVKELPTKEVGLKIVLDSNHKPLIIKVPIKNQDVLVQAWVKKVNGIKLFLLDTDLKENNINDRIITNHLYPSDKEIGLKQSMIIGIGGVRLLKAMKIEPEIYHISEGHSAMAAFELIGQEMKNRELNFNEAKQFARRRIVFTNHTLVPAGNKVFNNDLVSVLLSKYSQELKIPTMELIKFGLINEFNVFSLTMVGLRTAGIINAVSNLHSQKAKELWPDYPMVGVTNGIHIKTWNLLENPKNSTNLWSIHQKRKKILLDFIKKKTSQDWPINNLLIGWARRIVSYKRPTVLFENLKKLKTIAQNKNQPIKIVMAGQPHRSDEVGIQLLKEIRLLAETELKGLLVYLPEYNIEMAKLLISGCDVWLNTPVVGFEACGTSGMKAGLNGVLPFSTKDGWINEIEMYGKGWLIKNEAINSNILETLEKYIIPLYYSRNSKGCPEQWIRNMKNSREMILNDFSATRLLEDYIKMLYL